jgi:hypothetical protein
MKKIVGLSQAKYIKTQILFLTPRPVHVRRKVNDLQTLNFEQSHSHQKEVLNF